MQKTVQNDKKFCLLHSISEEPYIIWLLFMFLKLFMLCFFSYFFHFCEHFDFLGPYGVKGQKMVQNDKKLCLSRSISQEPYIIWLSFMVQMCKMISPGVFFNVKILIFQFVKGLKGQKSGPKCRKLLSVAPYISGTIYHMIFIYGAHVCIKG